MGEEKGTLGIHIDWASILTQDRTRRHVKDIDSILQKATVIRGERK